MRLSSARALKAELIAASIESRIVTTSQLPRVALVTPRAVPDTRPTAPISFGVRGKKQSYKLAVRIHDACPGIGTIVDEISRRARGEVDVRVVGRVVKQQPWHRRRNRPLRIGGSVGHDNTATGTLGCFVTRDGEEDRILSNNHVLANENDARIGDEIRQPGPADGGRRRDRVGSLERFVRLKQRRNRVDAATASLDEGIEYYTNWLETLGPINGVRSDPLEEGERVTKIGRTTGKTRGRVSVFELDGVPVQYDMGIITFDDQIEIEPVGRNPFSLGGDSGSLIVDSDRRAVGLLFAGNDVDATYANPMGEVLDALHVDLVD